MRRFIFASLTVACLTILPMRAEAAVILGTIDLAGQIQVTATQINWLPPGPLVDGSATGLATLTAPGTGIFAPYFPLFFCGLCAIEKDLNVFAEPVGVPLNLLNFETFTSAPTLSFSLTYIQPCIVCYDGFVGTPFNVYEGPLPVGGSGVEIIMNFSGIVTDPLNPLVFGSGLPWGGTWTAQFPGYTAAQLFNFIEYSPYAIYTSFSATKIAVAAPSAVPEPATLLLFGTGSVLLGARARRRAKKAKKDQQVS